MFALKLWPIWICFVACYSVFRLLAGRGLVDPSRAISWIFASLATGSPVVGIAVGAGRTRFVAIALSELLLLNAVLITIHNPYLPLLGAETTVSAMSNSVDPRPYIEQPREQQYFALRPDLYGWTAEIADNLVANGVTNVLLETSGETWEYPLWVFLKNRGFRGTIHQIAVINETAPLLANWPTNRSAVITMDTDLTNVPDYRRTVQCGNGFVSYPSLSLRRDIKLIENQAFLNLQIEKAGQVEIRCRPHQ